MPANELRLLALDGGGVRGLSSLLILEKLMEAVDVANPPKPCDYFDMIGGTSTGGLFAIMLGRLKMTVTDTITAYLELSDSIFQKKNSKIRLNGKIQGRFDSEELVHAVKKVLADQGHSGDILLKEESDPACRVFVCATSKETTDTVCFTSYATQRGNTHLLNTTKIWEACRATSAASSFFNPIIIGRYGQEFIDGATGANNPVRELWDQADGVWGPLENRLKYLVSIGTGVPSISKFADDIFHIGQTLLRIATDSEMTAESFRRERKQLANSGRYYRFNVTHGLEDIGLEEAKKIKEMAAVTDKYMASQEVHEKLQACAGNIAPKVDFGAFQTLFSLKGVPRVKNFVDRPEEMAKLENTLLPTTISSKKRLRQKVHVLHGMGGISKTQLAVEFARQHQDRFSSVFWLDGRNRSTLEHSIADHASRILEGQIPGVSRSFVSGSGSKRIETVVKDVMKWLAHPDNTEWLLIFDNVDLEYGAKCSHDGAYDVEDYFSGADHGHVLVTTRLSTMEQLGEAQYLGRVHDEQAYAIFTTWFLKEHDVVEAKHLLTQLDNLPLAISQAGAYLQQSGVGITKYLKFYAEHWNELMKSNATSTALMRDYPDRSISTT